ncbi:hypothetical protein AGMMS4956_20720 [Bacteroidia bacterium]|nr:hypothetical protein AGMMS4956_20720 [Bacteroidia bacterium]
MKQNFDTSFKMMTILGQEYFCGMLPDGRWCTLTNFYNPKLSTYYDEVVGLSTSRIEYHKQEGTMHTTADKQRINEIFISSNECWQVADELDVKKIEPIEQTACDAGFIPSVQPIWVSSMGKGTSVRLIQNRVITPPYNQ